jgi:hypothetical protein
VADTDKGKRFMLSTTAAQDYANLQASWERLDKGVETNRILLKASNTDPEPHSGGAPWPKGGVPYEAMKLLFSCWNDPASCAALLGSATGGENPPPQLPLLGSARGGHAWFDFCEGKADSAVLPPDPRSLVVPGANQDKAVYFNAFWKDCHADPERVHERPHPKTCGELRETTARGAILMYGNGVVGQASTFAGNEPNGYAAITAAQYNSLWQFWGMSSRPDNFDELVAERYGLGPNEVRNPYPLPGEDPNDPAHPGGTGQLPRTLLQTRNSDGSWSGNITTNCQGCHSTTIEGETIYGGGGNLLDAGLSGRDFGAAGLSPAGAVVIAFGGRTRGTNMAQFSNIAALGGAVSGEPPDPGLLDVITNGATATGDTPAWWNVGHRPLKFVDGMFSGDTVRVDMALFDPLLDKRPIPNAVTTGLASANTWVSEHAQDGDHWIMSLKSPAYPMPVDTALAEQGAILFHSKDLWASTLNNPVPEPEGGNGSCASCHGAYSPRYVNDPAYLDTPAMEGIASYVVPIEVIGTDPVRMDTYNEGTNEYLSRTYVAYPETQGTEQDCRVQNLNELRGDRPLGYAAPPLYGVWATAPYFHNGSVPNVWQVLKPEAREPIWRRVSKPARAGQEGKVIMGYDTRLSAYDQENVGWQYDALACGTGTVPYLECDPSDPNADPVLQLILGQVYSNVILAWNLTSLPPLTNEQIENRKIYNTGMWSQGNGGHEFTSVLTDQERRAIIEYLKTL